MEGIEPPTSRSLTGRSSTDLHSVALGVPYELRAVAAVAGSLLGVAHHRAATPVVTCRAGEPLVDRDGFEPSSCIRVQGGRSPVELQARVWRTWPGCWWLARSPARVDGNTLLRGAVPMSPGGHPERQSHHPSYGCFGGPTGIRTRNFCVRHRRDSVVTTGPGFACRGLPPWAECSTGSTVVVPCVPARVSGGWRDRLPATDLSRGRGGSHVVPGNGVPGCWCPLWSSQGAGPVGSAACPPPGGGGLHGWQDSNLHEPVFGDRCLAVQPHPFGVVSTKVEGRPGDSPGAAFAGLGGALRRCTFGEVVARLATPRGAQREAAVCSGGWRAGHDGYSWSLEAILLIHSRVHRQEGEFKPVPDSISLACHEFMMRCGR